MYMCMREPTRIMMCIEAQWGLYIEYMRETIDYTITIIPLTTIPLTFICIQAAQF
jgi:hypothetical protein